MKSHRSAAAVLAVLIAVGGWVIVGSGQQSAPGALGEHASSPPPVDLNGPKPGRTGLGNIAQLFDAHVSDLPQLLGQPCP